MVIDFSQPSELRQFELVSSDGRSLWANGHYLAEISPYFYALCFASGFKECREGRVELKDLSYEDLHELLRCVCPNEEFVYEKRIQRKYLHLLLIFSILAQNFALLTNLSSRLLLRNLRNQLEQFARHEENLGEASASTLLEMVAESIAAQLDSETVTSLCRCLARQLTKNLPDQCLASLVEQKVRPFVDFYHPAVRGTICGSPYHMGNIRLFF